MVRLGASGVCMDAYEITNEEWVRFLNAHGEDCSFEGEYLSERCQYPFVDYEFAKVFRDDASGEWRTKPGFELHPAAGTWHGARAACEWKEARLCTIDEIMVGCAGPEARIYSYGDEYLPCRCAVYDNRAFANCDLQDTFPVNAFPGCEGGYTGLFHLLGNAFEWSASCIVSSGSSGPTRSCSFVPGYLHSQLPDAESVTCQSASSIAFTGGDMGFRCCMDLE
jgi:formylglycine-generating enzyme required for sulfatase activity